MSIQIEKLLSSMLVETIVVTIGALLLVYVATEGIKWFRSLRGLDKD